MTRLQRAGVIALCVAVAGGSLIPALQRGRAASPAPATRGMSAEATMDALVQKLTAAQEKIGDLMPSMSSLGDPAFRAATGPKIVPLLREGIGYWTELEKVVTNDATREVVRTNKFRFMAIASALGDKETEKSLEAIAAGSVKMDVVSAQTALLLDKWMLSSTDAAAQAKLLETFAPVAKANADNDEVAVALGFMANVGGADKESGKKVMDVLHNLTGDAAKAIIKQIDLAQLKLDMVNRPLVLTGDTPGGGAFSSESLKGKVVLVDLWATWCGPCVASLPELKEIYKAHHGEGFEILGVSSDESVDALTKFTKDNEMPWTELWDKSQAEVKPPLNPINRKYGFNAIPAAMLIDKQGVVRYMRYFEDTPEGTVRRDLGDHATQSLEEQVKGLLAEAAKP